ncbi:transketolase [uncultured Reyranella sp.]|jgi:transketolase|uniref:transketolase n=1 Tax=uncultured Reyranella sp. TaxID=735512 RepID=UPI00259D05FC|nr:transketolase [uncultured Reyranella sp.]
MTARPNLPDPADVRRTILKILFEGQASHLGTSMSMVEILIAAYGACDVGAIRRGENGRDRVFVSKGHGAACTYSVMHHFGLLDAATIATYHKNGSELAGHVSHAVPGVEHSTGALGHGLPVAVGAAIGLRSKGFDDALVFCVMGDGEIQEGAVWEALMLAHHQKLNRLIPIVDNNRISSIKATREVINLEPLADRFRGFGFAVHDIDGHDLAALTGAIAAIRAGDKPSVIIANTTKGKGVPFAENQPIWHYRSLNKETYEQAVAALKGDVS